MQSTDDSPCRVRVWFGSEVICSHTAPLRLAQRYADRMAMSFRGLAVTIDAKPDTGDTPLPHELLWDRTVG